MASIALQFRPEFKIKTKPNANKHKLAVLFELPDFVALLWFATLAGASLEQALRATTAISIGLVAKDFARALAQVDLGSTLGDELEELAAKNPSFAVQELASKLAFALSHGASLADALNDFSESTQQAVRAELLAQAGKNETKMLIPLVFLILPITVLFVCFPIMSLVQSTLL